MILTSPADTLLIFLPKFPLFYLSCWTNDLDYKTKPAFALPAEQPPTWVMSWCRHRRAGYFGKWALLKFLGHCLVRNPHRRCPWCSACLVCFSPHLLQPLSSLSCPQNTQGVLISTLSAQITAKGTASWLHTISFSSRTLWEQFHLLRSLADPHLCGHLSLSISHDDTGPQGVSIQWAKNLESRLVPAFTMLSNTQRWSCSTQISSRKDVLPSWWEWGTQIDCSCHPCRRASVAEPHCPELCPSHVPLAWNNSSQLK